MGLKLNALANHSIKTRVTVFTLVIFVLCLWTLSFYASSVLRKDMQRLLGEQQFSAVSMIAAEINNELSDGQAGLEQIARQIDGRKMAAPTALQAMLEQNVFLGHIFNGGLFITDSRGTAIADVPLSAGRIGTNYMDRESIAVPLQQGITVIGAPTMGKKLRAPLFSVAAPIRDAGGRVIGTVVGAVNLEKPSFLDKISGKTFGETGSYVLADRPRRVFITGTDTRRIMSAFPAPGVSQALDRIAQGYEGTLAYLNPSGVEVMASVKGIAAADWVLGITLPTAEAHAPIYAMRLNFWLATLLLTLMATGLTWWILRRELSPLLTTAKLLAQAAQSNAPPKALPVTSQNEVGLLVSSFNRMLDKLRQREVTLVESEMFKSGILNAMTSHIAVIDHSGVIIAVNEAWTRFALTNSNEPGQTAPRTGIGMNYLEICQGLGTSGVTVDQTAHDGILQVLQGRVPSFSLDYPCHSPHEQRWFNLTASPIGAPGEAGAVIVHTNITEQKVVQIQLARYRDHLEDMVAQQTNHLEQSNADLRASEVKLQRTTDLLEKTGAMAKVGGWEMDLKTMQVDWSAQIFRILEREPAGLQTVDQATNSYVPDSQAKIHAAVAQALRHGIPWDLELQAITDKGHTRWIHSRCHLEQKEGKVVRMLGSVHDVTDSVLSRHANEEHQQSLQICFDNQQTGVAIFSESALLYCNPAFRSLLGYGPTQSLGHLTMGSLVPSADPHYLHARHKRAKTYGETLPPKLMKLSGNGGAIVSCLLSGSIVPWGGTPQFLASVTPLGDSGRVENEIRATEERYERLLVTQIEQMQAHIARELHDSLGSRLAGVGMLLGGVLQKHPELTTEIRMALDQIQAAAQGSRTLSHSLMPVDTSSGAFWRSLERLCLDYAKIAGVQCLFSMQGDFEDVEPEIGNHLFRIAQEALINAVKHGHASKVAVSLQERQAGYAMTVVDNGGQLAPQRGDTHSSSGIGLKSMQARARMIGGAFKWYVNDSGGVTVSIDWNVESD